MVDDFDIRTLPVHFVPKSQPSVIIERLNEKRKNAHDAALEAMHKRKSEVDGDIDEETKHRSRILVAKINDAKNDVETILDKLKNMDENELILEENKFEIITNKILETNKNRTYLIDEFEKFLGEIERKRLDNFKLILNETYDKMSQIYHQLPFELEEYFENEILKINQVSLNNYQKHSELQAELKLQIENDTKVWTQQSYEIRENIKILLKELARKKLMKSKKKLRKGWAERRADMLENEFFDYGLMDGEDEAGGPLDPSSPVVLRDVERWIKDIRNTLATIDGTAKNCVHFYKETIVVLFNRFFEEMQQIKKELKSSGYVNKEEIEEFQSEIYTPAAEELNLECLGDFQHLQDVWNEVINSMQATIDETYKCLKMATGLWENHFQRIEDIQQLVLRNVKVAVQKNSISSEKTEIKLNIAVDKMRQAPSEQKLGKSLIEVKKILDVIEKTYKSNSLSEMNIIKKYRISMESEIEVLMSEIQRYLTIHPVDEERDPKKQRGRGSQTSITELTADEQLIPPQMLFCQFQVDAVNNWMFGLWEALHQYLSIGREEILTVADQWIDFQCNRVQKRLEVRLSFHSPRYERVKCVVYERRLEELTSHSIRFNMHKLAVEERIKGIKEKQKANEEKYNEICKKYMEVAEKYESKILKSKYSYQIQRYKGNLKNLTRETREEIDQILNDNDNICQNILVELKTANVKYMSAIRLFAEYGNYTAEETKALLKALNKLEKSTGKSLQAIGKEDKSKYNKYSAKILGEDSDVTSVMEEVAAEHKQNENTVKQIKALQDDVRFDVVALRTEMKNLNVSFRELMEESMRKLGDHTYLEQFSNKLQDVVTYIFDQGKFLVHPEPVVMYTPSKNKISASQSKGPVGNYASSIFGTRPKADDGCFLSKVIGRLYRSLQEIESNAKIFYSTHTYLLLDPTKLHQSFDAFMSEVLEKYRGFLIQCEISWSENASDFLNLLNDFIEFKDDFLAKFEDKMRSLGRDRCKAVADDIMRQMRDERGEMKRKYREVHEKLKALHGHPKNKDLLGALQEEFAELVSELSEKLEEILEPYSDILVEEHEKVRNTFEETKDTLEVLGQDYGLSDLRTFLNGQITTKLQLMNEMVGVEPQIEQSEVTVDPNSDVGSEFDVPLSVSKQVIAYMKTAGFPAQAKTVTLKSDSTLTTTEKTERDFPTELEESCEENIKIITAFVSTEMVQYHDDFQKIWVNEVGNVLALYKVKYDMPIGSEKKGSQKKGSKKGKK